MSEAVGLQAALAHLLVEDNARRDLHESPGAIRERFGLSDDELATLREIDPARLALMAQLGRTKRLDFLQRGLPATLAAVRLLSQGAVLGEFVRTTVPHSDTTEATRVLVESCRFGDYLASTPHDGLPAWIHDIATFEIAHLELGASKKASESVVRAERIASATRPPWEGALESLGCERLRLAEHVRVQRFEHDVLSLCAALRKGLPTDIAPAPTYVTYVKGRGRPRISTFRTGQTLAVMLRLCTEPRSLPEILAACRPESEERTGEAIRSALSQGVLVIDDRERACASVR